MRSLEQSLAFWEQQLGLSVSLRETVAAEKGVDLATAERGMVAASKTTRVGEPADIAALVAFIVGTEGRFLQGAMIDMDGGSTKTS